MSKHQDEKQQRPLTVVNSPAAGALHQALAKKFSDFREQRDRCRLADTEDKDSCLEQVLDIADQLDEIAQAARVHEPLPEEVSLLLAQVTVELNEFEQEVRQSLLF